MLNEKVLGIKGYKTYKFIQRLKYSKINVHVFDFVLALDSKLNLLLTTAGAPFTDQHLSIPIWANSRKQLTFNFLPECRPLTARLRRQGLPTSDAEPFWPKPKPSRHFPGSCQAVSVRAENRSCFWAKWLSSRLWRLGCSRTCDDEPTLVRDLEKIRSCNLFSFEFFNQHLFTRKILEIREELREKVLKATNLLLSFLKQW